MKGEWFSSKIRTKQRGLLFAIIFQYFVASVIRERKKKHSYWEGSRKTVFNLWHRDPLSRKLYEIHTCPHTFLPWGLINKFSKVILIKKISMFPCISNKHAKNEIKKDYSIHNNMKRIKCFTIKRAKIHVLKLMKHFWWKLQNYVSGETFQVHGFEYWILSGLKFSSNRYILICISYKYPSRFFSAEINKFVLKFINKCKRE